MSIGVAPAWAARPLNTAARRSTPTVPSTTAAGSSRLEHRALLDVQLEVGARALQLRARLVHLREVDVVAATTSSSRSPSRSLRSRTSSTSSVPAHADEPNRLRPKRAPSSSAQSTKRSPTGRSSSAWARSASSAPKIPSAPSSQPPAGTVDVRADDHEALLLAREVGPHVARRVGLDLDRQLLELGAHELARLDPLVGPAPRRAPPGPPVSSASSRRSAMTRPASITRRRRPRPQRARHEAAVAGRGEDLAAVVDERAAAERLAHAAGRGLALEEVVVDVHVRRPGRELERRRRIEHHEVGVHPRRDRALAREPEAPRDRRRGLVDELRRRHAPAGHAEVPQLHEPVLDHRQPVGDLREVVAAERLLLAVERAVVGRDALEHAAPQRAPQQLLVANLAQWRRADVAGALEVGAREVVDGVGQVLQAGLAGDRTPRA